MVRDLELAMRRTLALVAGQNLPSRKDNIVEHLEAEICVNC